MKSTRRNQHACSAASICTTVIEAAFLGWILFSCSPTASALEEGAGPNARVWVEPVRWAAHTSNDSAWYPAPIERIELRVIEFDRRQLRYRRVGGDAVTSVSADRVVWIERIEPSEAEQQAWLRHAAGDSAAAEALFLRAAVASGEVWHQKLLSVMAARSAWRGGRYDRCLLLIERLSKLELPPLVIGALPIHWGEDSLGESASAAATAWLNKGAANTRLVAASWRLGSPDDLKARRLVSALFEASDLGERAGKYVSLARAARFLAPEAFTSPSASNARAGHAAVIAALDRLPMCLQSGPAERVSAWLDSQGATAAATELRLAQRITPLNPLHFQKAHHP